MSNTIIKILAEVFGLPESEIHLALTKKDVGSWDSLKQMDLVTTLEQKFDVVIEIADIQRMVSVADILEVLREKGVSVEA
mgnify:CR=1 FL=1